MELKNKGTFFVVYRKEINKHIIIYNEKGIVTPLNKFEFDSYDLATDYIKDNKEELDNYITSLKEAERKRKEAEEVERLRKEEEAKKEKEEKEKKKKQFFYDFKRFMAGFLAAVVTLVGGHFAAKGISTAIKERNSNKPSTSQTGDLDPTENTEPTIETIAPTEPTVVEEVLTNEVYEELVAKFTKIYTDNNINVTTEDLIKFVSIVNIDKLVEDNPELATELFSETTKEEYLNDAAKVIGMTYTYNYNLYQQEGTTENFIRISESISGPQKEVLQVVESYVDKIAAAKDDAEEVNRLVAELLQKLGDPTSELSYLDDGVGFGMQVCIELIRSCIAKDVLTQENWDMLAVLTSSEEYVSNIFTVYDRCIGASGVSKTR